VFEARCGHRTRAIQLAEKALDSHVGTGRLWAALVQLKQEDGEWNQLLSLRQALRSVPKSGEVWCEGARLHLNPCVPTFDLRKAAKHLCFATQFTPQYGDSFVENLRLEILLHVVQPVADYYIESLTKSIFYAEKSPHEYKCKDNHIVEFACEAAASIWLYLTNPTMEGKSNTDMISRRLASRLILSFNPRNLSSIDTSDLELRCSNADPNYGLLWFHCRQRPTDISRTILSQAKFLLAENLATHSFLYIAAMIRRAGIIILMQKETIQTENGKISKRLNLEDLSSQWENSLEARLRAAPSISEVLPEKILKLTSNKNDLISLSICESDFITGLTGVNQLKPLEKMSVLEKRKILFGNDSHT